MWLLLRRWQYGALVFSLSGVAAAQAREEGLGARRSWATSVEAATAAGRFLRLSVAPEVGPERAAGAALGGYDGASRAPVFQSYAEARLAWRVALRMETGLGSAGRPLQPALGGRVQLLTQDEHGVNGALLLRYKAEGFDEPEGELESVVSLSRRFDQLLLLANLAYGQDPEGNERDAEISLAWLLGVTPWLNAGVDSKARLAPRTWRSVRAEQEPSFDFDAGPVVCAALGPLALSGHAGVAALQRTAGATQWGAVAIAGIGTAF